MVTLENQTKLEMPYVFYLFSNTYINHTKAFEKLFFA